MRWVKTYGDYVINKKGQVKNTVTGRILSPVVGANGYPFVNLKQGIDGQSPKNIHRLLAEAFIPNPENLPMVNHKDENKLNYDIDNLEWSTYDYNNKHSAHKQYREYEIVNPKGKIIKIKGLGQFCRDNNLTYQNIQKVIRGERPHHKGWTRNV